MCTSKKLIKDITSLIKERTGVYPGKYAIKKLRQKTEEELLKLKELWVLKK